MRVQRLGDLGVPERQFLPAPYGASQGDTEQIMAGVISTVDATRGQITGQAVSTVFVGTQTVYPMGRPKSILVIASGTLTQAGAGQATVRLFGARTPKAAYTGAATGQPTADGGFFASAAASFGPNAAIIPNGGYWFTPTQIPELQWDTDHIGVEVNFVGGAPTQGAIAVICIVSPN